MLPCNDCAYRRDIPGDAHVACVFDWPAWLAERSVAIMTGAEDGTLARTWPMAAPVKARVRQWYQFPWNYDPVWGPDTCPGRAEVADIHRVKEFGAMDTLFQLLGKRMA